MRNAERIALTRVVREGVQEAAVSDAQPLFFEVSAGQHVSGLIVRPLAARSCVVLAHGAGAGMMHTGMAALATGLAARDIATLRFQFPFMENGSKRPDSPAVAHAAVRAAAMQASQAMPDLPLFAGGRSFGGRMTSQAQAKDLLPSVRGLIFFAFPLHPAKRPSNERATHLSDVSVPMLFLSGTRDALADSALLDAALAPLGPRATLLRLEGADHAFHVPARSGRSDREVLNEALDGCAEWIARVASGETDGRPLP